MCRVTKRLDIRIDESVFRWFGLTERIVNDRTTKRVYVGDGVCGSLCR